MVIFVHVWKLVVGVCLVTRYMQSSHTVNGYQPKKRHMNICILCFSKTDFWFSPRLSLSLSSSLYMYLSPAAPCLEHVIIMISCLNLPSLLPHFLQPALWIAYYLISKVTIFLWWPNVFPHCYTEHESLRYVVWVRVRFPPWIKYEDLWPGYAVGFEYLNNFSQ